MRRLDNPIEMPQCKADGPSSAWVQNICTVCWQPLALVVSKSLSQRYKNAIKTVMYWIKFHKIGLSYCTVIKFHGAENWCKSPCRPDPLLCSAVYSGSGSADSIVSYRIASRCSAHAPLSPLCLQPNKPSQRCTPSRCCTKNLIRVSHSLPFNSTILYTFICPPVQQL